MKILFILLQQKVGTPGKSMEKGILTIRVSNESYYNVLAMIFTWKCE